MKQVIKKHPLAIRWLHWIHFPLLIIMTWSGLLIYWAYQPYRIGWGNMTIVKFFPKEFNQALNIPYRLAEGMSIHFTFMWLFAINGFLYLSFLLVSGQWKLLFPSKKTFGESIRFILNDLKIRKQPDDPAIKYNAAQRVIYSGVILMGAFMLLTGLAIYKPVQLNWLCALLGGYAAARLEHFIITILFCLFFLVHVIQVFRAGWNNFRSMLTGFEVNENNRESARNEDEA